MFCNFWSLNNTENDPTRVCTQPIQSRSVRRRMAHVACKALSSNVITGLAVTGTIVGTLFWKVSRSNCEVVCSQTGDIAAKGIQLSSMGAFPERKDPCNPGRHPEHQNDDVRNMTLSRWQEYTKPRQDLIVQASTTDGHSGRVPASIGLSYYALQGLDQFESLQYGSHEHTVLSMFADFTDNQRRGKSPIRRQKIIETLRRNGITTTNTAGQGKDFVKYARLLGDHKFAISPEGNGIDCHRHYESLIMGTIPVVEDSLEMRESYGNVPILYTVDYSEITTDYLEKVYPSFLSRRWDFSQLFLSSWPPGIQQGIKKRSVTWMKKKGKTNWYETKA